MISRATRITHKALDMYSVSPADLNISSSEHDVLENDMSPSVSEMQNENSMCVLATTEHVLELVHLIRKTKPI